MYAQNWEQNRVCLLHCDRQGENNLVYQHFERACLGTRYEKTNCVPISLNLSYVKGNRKQTFSTFNKTERSLQHPANSALTISKHDVFVIDLVFIELVQTEVVSSVGRGVNGEPHGSVRVYKTGHVNGLSKPVPLHVEGLPYVRATACR